MVELLTGSATLLIDRPGVVAPGIVAGLTGSATVMAVGLAAVFTLAAITKLMAPAATAAEFKQLGLPGAAGLARAVPAAELLIATALVVAPPLGCNGRGWSARRLHRHPAHRHRVRTRGVVRLPGFAQP